LKNFFWKNLVKYKIRLLNNKSLFEKKNYNQEVLKENCIFKLFFNQINFFNIKNIKKLILISKDKKFSLI